MRVVLGTSPACRYSYIRTVLTQQGTGSPPSNTLVKRLVKKGALIQEKGEVYYYTAVYLRKKFTKRKTGLPPKRFTAAV